MASKKSKDKIISETSTKVMIKVDRLEEVLNEQELESFFTMINKIKRYDKDK